MSRLRSGAATAATAILIAALAGCATDSAKDGPPFDPGDIQNLDSLLITTEDVEAAGPSTPYGAVLAWWRALQIGDVEGVRSSYAVPISAGEAKREISTFRRFSQPINPSVHQQGIGATIDTHVRTASRFGKTPDVISVRDFPTHFYLVHQRGGWRLRRGSYRHYKKSQRFSRLAVG
jgi:hypothetical protein